MNPFSLQALAANQAPPGATGATVQGLPAAFSPSSVVQDTAAAMYDPNSALIRNARQRGAEAAAARGGINSSIAAGNAERAALESAVMPMTQMAMGLQEQREGQAFQSQQQDRAAVLNNWLAENSAQRDFAQSLAMMPIRSSMDMLSAIQQYAMSDPTLYTPEVISGYSNFFQQNMKQIMSGLFQGGQ